MKDRGCERNSRRHSPSHSFDPPGRLRGTLISSLGTNRQFARLENLDDLLSPLPLRVAHDCIDLRAILACVGSKIRWHMLADVFVAYDMCFRVLDANGCAGRSLTGCAR